MFMSKLIYLMPVWAGCEDYLTKALKVIQNKVARSVTKKDIFTPTKVLMKECGWLTVRQLMVYHSLIQVHKTIQHKTPAYLYERVTSQLSLLETGNPYYYKTRQKARGVLRQVPEAEAKLDLADRSWCWRAAKSYHNLPLSLKLESKLSKFKKELRAWVIGNIET